MSKSKGEHGESKGINFGEKNPARQVLQETKYRQKQNPILSAVILLFSIFKTHNLNSIGYKKCVGTIFFKRFIIEFDVSNMSTTI
jgi:hypothetical protein